MDICTENFIKKYLGLEGVILDDKSQSEINSLLYLVEGLSSDGIGFLEGIPEDEFKTKVSSANGSNKSILAFVLGKDYTPSFISPMGLDYKERFIGYFKKLKSIPGVPVYTVGEEYVAYNSFILLLKDNRILTVRFKGLSGSKIVVSNEGEYNKGNFKKELTLDEFQGYKKSSGEIMNMNYSNLSYDEFAEFESSTIDVFKGINISYRHIFYDTWKYVKTLYALDLAREITTEDLHQYHWDEVKKSSLFEANDMDSISRVVDSKWSGVGGKTFSSPKYPKYTVGRCSYRQQKLYYALDVAEEEVCYKPSSANILENTKRILESSKSGEKSKKRFEFPLTQVISKLEEYYIQEFGDGRKLPPVVESVIKREDMSKLEEKYLIDKIDGSILDSKVEFFEISEYEDSEEGLFDMTIDEEINVYQDTENNDIKAVHMEDNLVSKVALTNVVENLELRIIEDSDVVVKKGRGKKQTSVVGGQMAFVI